MKIVPQAQQAAPQASEAPQSSAQAARARAIAMLTSGAPQANAQPTGQEHPVQSPTNISPEEFSVVKSNTSSEKSAQNDTNRSTSPESDVDAGKPAEAKAEPTEDELLSTQYANLARKEKALRAKVQAEQQAYREKVAALEAREKALQEKEAEYTSNYVPKAKLKQNPLAVLTEEGISYDDITQAILNPQVQQDPRVTAEIEKLKAEIQSQRQEQEKIRKGYEDQQTRAYQQAVNEIRNETKVLVSNDPNFETIKETGSVDDVVDLIEKTYHKEGILLTVEEAAREVEEYLVEEATKLSKIKKIREKLLAGERPSATVQKQSEQTEPQKQQTAQPMKTLTNSVNASKRMNARERAIAAFKGNLK